MFEDRGAWEWNGDFNRMQMMEQPLLWMHSHNNSKKTTKIENRYFIVDAIEWMLGLLAPHF